MISDRIRALNVPHVEEYFGLWAILDDRLKALVEHANRVDLGSHVRERRERADWGDGDGPDMGYLVDRGVAIVELNGPLTKYGSSLASGTSTVQARRQIRLAANDPEVSAIVVCVDSPGGAVNGIDDLAQDVDRADELKPTVGYIEDLGASAGYWPLTQARKVFANRGALVGGIGVYTTITDSSQRAANEGLKVHVVRSASLKGAGAAGTEVGEEELGELQRIVDARNEQFVRAVASGRNLTLARARELADARVHTAAVAKELGLIDDVKSLDEVIDSLAKKKPKAKSDNRGARAMSEELPEPRQVQMQVADLCPRAATLQELKAELAGAPADFLLAQLEASATLPQASKAWIAELNARNTAQAESLKAAEAKAAEAAKKPVSGKPGTDPLPTSAIEGSAPADAIAHWDALVEAELKALPVSKQKSGFGSITPTLQAKQRAADKHPEAHAAYLTAYAALRKKQFPNRNMRAMRLSEAATIAADAS